MSDNPDLRVFSGFDDQPECASPIEDPEIKRECIWSGPVCKPDLVLGLEQAQPLSHRFQVEIRRMIFKGEKTAADAARIFKIHPATVSRLLARKTKVRAVK